MNIADILGAHAAARPDAPAIAAPGASLDYRALDESVWRAAKWFAGRGIAAGDVVAVALGDSVLHLVAAYALARLGAVQIAIRANESQSLRQDLIGRFAARAVLAENPGTAPGAIQCLAPDAGWLAAGRDEAAPSLRSPGGSAGWKIITSSGTTGAPKAMLQSHAGHIAWRDVGLAAIPLNPSTRTYVAINLGFTLGLRVCMDVLAAGGTVVIGAPAESRDRPGALEAHGINYLCLTPTHVHQLLRQLPQDRPRLPQLMLRVGTMVVPDALRAEIRRRLTPNFFVSYGVSDLGAGTSLLQASGEIQDRFPGTIGLPSPGVEFQIVDDSDRLLPPDAVGHIRIRGPAMPTGYLHNPAASAQAFRGGWFYPGDLGSRNAEGAVFHKGRADDLMNLDGIKIYPSDIEAALLEHPSVAEAAAFPLRSAVHQHIPAAAVVLRAPASEDALLRWMRERLGLRAPRYILPVAALQRNAMGKVLKGDLAAQLRQRLAADR